MMRSYILAEKLSLPKTFGSEARFIRKRGTEGYAHILFRRNFELNTLPHNAVLLGMTANFADIYINGRLAVTLSERSYIFDKTYEAFDVLPFLKEGENIIAVADIDTGEAVRAGFAIELSCDGETVLWSDDAWLCTEDTSVNHANYYISGGIEERVNADNFIAFAENSFDDSAWENAEIIGNELLHAPYDSFRQSVTKAQTADLCYPTAFSAVLLAKDPTGCPMRLAPSNNGVTLAMTMLTLCEAQDITFLTHGGIRGISVDGCRVSENEKLTLENGVHLLTIAYMWSPEFFIQTSGKLQFASPNGGELPFASLLLPTPPVRYPWNVYRGRSAVDERVDEILTFASFDILSAEEKASVQAAGYDMPESILHDIRSRSLFLPADGMAEERLLKHSHITPCECLSGFANRETLLSEYGTATVTPRDGALNFILDFGVERVGRIELSLDAPAGTVIELHAFEIISDLGINYMSEFQTMRYVCRDGEQIFLSRRRRGFRYLSVSVMGMSREVNIHSIRILETRYPVKKGNFVCSDETINQIYGISTRTAEVCMLDLYVDCPGFEQNPWTGDARVTANINLYNFGAFAFDAEYLRLIAESVTDGVARIYRRGNPRYAKGYYLPCACFPTYPEGCIPIWSFMWLLQVCDHYDCTGDIQLVKDVFYAVRETLSRCEMMTNSRGLFDMKGAWNLIEWAYNDLSFFGEVTANNAMLSYCFKKAAFLAELMGDNALAEHYLEMSVKYKDAVNRYCFSAERNAYVDTVRDEYAYKEYFDYMKERNMEILPYETFAAQTRISVQTATMVLLYDCVPDERKAAAECFLLDNLSTGHYNVGTPSKKTVGDPTPEEAPDGYVHIGSPFFLFFALKALYKLGYDDLAFTAQKRDFGNFLALGFTTCLESFLSGAEFTRSVAHAWSASPAYFFVTEILGVKPVKAGYREFSVTPKTSYLDFAKGDVPTPYGDIHVEWTKNADGTVDIFCTAPDECVRT